MVESIPSPRNTSLRRPGGLESAGIHSLFLRTSSDKSLAVYGFRGSTGTTVHFCSRIEKFILDKMDGVSSAASVVAVVTLALQLGKTIQKINSFLRNIEEAPKEVVRLIETLDQLHGTLDHARELFEQQFLVLRLPGSPLFITRALETCENHISELTTISTGISRSFGHQRKVRRTWASMRFVVKKQELEDIRCRLRDAKMDLQSALSSNLWHLQCEWTRFGLKSLLIKAQVTSDTEYQRNWGF